MMSTPIFPKSSHYAISFRRHPSLSSIRMTVVRYLYPSLPPKLIAALPFRSNLTRHPSSQARHSFRNPVFPEKGQDPGITASQSPIQRRQPLPIHGGGGRHLQ